MEGGGFISLLASLLAYFLAFSDVNNP